MLKGLQTDNYPTEKDRERERERQRDRERETETDRERQRENKRQTQKDAKHDGGLVWSSQCVHHPI